MRDVNSVRNIRRCPVAGVVQTISASQLDQRTFTVSWIIGHLSTVFTKHVTFCETATGLRPFISIRRSVALVTRRLSSDPSVTAPSSSMETVQRASSFCHVLVDHRFYLIFHAGRHPSPPVIPLVCAVWMFDRWTVRSMTCSAFVTTNKSMFCFLLKRGMTATPSVHGVCVLTALRSFVVYHPGSIATSPKFFEELLDVLDELATFAEPVLLVGDINIRLERLVDLDVIRFTDVIAARGLINCVTGATHNLGGLLDVVMERSDLRPSRVDVIDVGLSDHRLLRWPMTLTRPSPIYPSVTGRPWTRLDTNMFRAALMSHSLSLANLDAWTNLSVDELTQKYDSEITCILDRMVLVKTVRCRHRSSDPYIDEENRVAKRCVRRIERAVRRVAPTDVSAVAAATASRKLIGMNTWHYWNENASLFGWRRLLQSAHRVDSCGGPLTRCWAAGVRQRLLLFESITFINSSNDKVSGVRASTDDAPPPSFTTVPSGCSMHTFRSLTTMNVVVAAVRLLTDKLRVAISRSRHGRSTDSSSQRKRWHPGAVPRRTLQSIKLMLGVVPSVFKT